MNYTKLENKPKGKAMCSCTIKGLTGQPLMAKAHRVTRITINYRKQITGILDNNDYEVK